MASELTADQRKACDEAAALADWVGMRTVAYMVGVNRVTVRRWARRERLPREKNARQIHRVWLVVNVFIQAGEKPQTAKNWLIGCDPRLNGQVPATVILDGGWADAMKSAEDFVAYP